MKFEQYMLCAKKNFLSYGRKWAQLWFGSYEKIKFKKNKKIKKIIEYDGSQFFVQ